MPPDPSPPKGWHSRGYLPHLDVPGLLQSVTFHLADSLPRQAVEQLYAGTAPDDPERLHRIEPGSIQAMGPVGSAVPP